MIMDVILRNDPLINDVYVEAATSFKEKLKRLWQSFLTLLRKIKMRLRYTFDSKVRKVRLLIKYADNPEVAEKWKKERCHKWDTEHTIEVFSTGIKLCDTIEEFKATTQELDVNNPSGNEAVVKKLNDIKDRIIACNNKLKQLTDVKPKEPIENGWTMYDMAIALKNEYNVVKEYYHKMSVVDDYNKSTVDSLLKAGTITEETAELFNKIIGQWTVGFGYIRQTNFFGIIDEINVNATVDYQKEKRKKKPVKEYYTKGMNDMDDNMFNEEHVSLDELDAYIEYAMDDLHDAMELRNRLIQESDDDTVEDFEESDDDFSDDYEEEGRPNTRNSTINQYDTANRDANITKYCLKRKLPNTDYSDMEELHDQSVKTKKKIQQRLLHTNAANTETNKKYKYNESYEDTIIHNYNEPVQENKTYCLKTNNMFTTESYDEPTGPDRFVQESYIRQLNLDLDDTLTEEEFFDEHYVPEFYKESYIGVAVSGAVIGFALGSALSAGIIYIDKLITDNKYGRFPKDMKAVYDIIKTEGFEASDNTKKLKKAFRHLNADLVYMLGGFGSRWKLTVDEAEEVKKLKDYVDDLYTRGWMLTKNKEKSDKRRVPERIEAFVKQGNKVLEMLSKSEYKSTLVKEYMS